MEIFVVTFDFFFTEFSRLVSCYDEAVTRVTVWLGKLFFLLFSFFFVIKIEIFAALVLARILQLEAGSWLVRVCVLFWVFFLGFSILKKKWHSGRSVGDEESRLYDRLSLFISLISISR